MWKGNASGDQRAAMPAICERHDLPVYSTGSFLGAGVGVEGEVLDDWVPDGPQAIRLITLKIVAAIAALQIRFMPCLSIKRGTVNGPVEAPVGNPDFRPDYRLSWKTISVIFSRTQRIGSQR